MKPDGIAAHKYIRFTTATELRQARRERSGRERMPLGADEETTCCTLCMNSVFFDVDELGLLIKSEGDDFDMIPPDYNSQNQMIELVTIDSNEQGS